MNPEVGRLLEEVKDIARVSISAASGRRRERSPPKTLNQHDDIFLDEIGWRSEAAQMRAHKAKEEEEFEYQRQKERAIAENLAALFKIGNTDTHMGKLYEQSLIVLAEKCSDPTLSQHNVEQAVSKWMATQLPILNLLQQRAEIYAAMVLQRSWRNYVRRIGR